MDFEFVPSDPVCFDKLSRCDLQTVGGSASGQASQAGVQPEGDHGIWEPRGQVLTVSPDRIEIRARDTQPIKGVSHDTICKGVQALAPLGSRKKILDKKSPLWVYVSPSISQTNNKLWAAFENKKRDWFL